MWWQVLLGILAGLILLYAVLLVVLWRVARRADEPLDWSQAARLLPDVLRLLKRLAGDSSLPSGVRIRLGLMLAYLLCPIDLIPDFVPVLGYADDAVVVGIAIRSATRAAGAEALERHWPGTPEGLAVIRRFAGRPQT